MLGAADAISNAIVSGDITHTQGEQELAALVLTMVERSQAAGR